MRMPQIVERDDNVPMQAENEQERNAIMNGVWLVRAERERLLKWVNFHIVEGVSDGPRLENRSRWPFPGPNVSTSAVTM